MSKVAPSDWEPPEHLSLSERDFLVDRAETINGIVAASWLQCGQVLLQVKRKFKRDPDLNGWYKRWCDECLPFSYGKAKQIVSVAEAAEDDPEIIQLTASNGYNALYKALLLPTKARKALLDLLKSGEELTIPDIDKVKADPEVAVEAAQETVERMEENLVRLELQLLTISSGDKRRDYETQARNQRTRLQKALQQLQEAKAKVSSLEESGSAQEAVLRVLQNQLKNRDLLIENMNLDPEHSRKRELAKTVRDATNGLDLLLATLDKYDLDKDAMGDEAVRTIERKMEEVRAKLGRHAYS